MPTHQQSPISPNPPRWQSSSDPTSIHVPGLDTTASVHDQIDQIEQLITIKLQNIDENFSKIHNLLANTLLPAVKRYAVGTEPVREAAKFWTSFYEQAAQIHIPTYDDYSTTNEQPPEHEEYDATATDSRPTEEVTITQTQDDGPSISSNESSFMPGQAAFSSTPATARLATKYHSFMSETSDDPSWSASMETPHPTPPPNPPPPSPQQSRSNKGKGKDSAQPLLRNVLKRTLLSASDISSSDVGLHSLSPSKSKRKPKTPVPKAFNPYLPPETDPDDWDGIVDLQDSPLTTPRRSGYSTRRNPATPDQDSDDDSFDGLPSGMSPPVLMSPARPPRSLAELGLVGLKQTPSKQASARIKRDILADIQRQSGVKEARKIYGYSHGSGGGESSMSTIPTPPSLSRYHRPDSSDDESAGGDASLESMMRRVALNIPPGSGATGSTPGLRLRPRSTFTKLEPTESSSTPVYKPAEAVTPGADLIEFPEDFVNPGSDSDSDSLDEVNNTAHPSAAFLMASRGVAGADDSFGSSNHSDSPTEEDADLALAPVHPFAQVVEDDGFDDSFDDDGFQVTEGGPPEETLFGVPPAERVRMENAQLKMLGEGLLQTRGPVASGSHPEETPTPANWPR
ncbi:DASH complex subunit Ask1-domain-containing protein [Infundibulicybe gibba]|nr:DASH complex subunit Ask1-domain-containing protein [Infundibulicybe gibba]